MLIYSIEDQIQKAHKEAQAKIQALKLVPPIVPLLEEIGNLWHEPVDHTIAIGSGLIDCISVDMRLNEEDSIRMSTRRVLEFCLDHPQLRFVRESQFPDLEWIMWKFAVNDAYYWSDYHSKSELRIGLRFYYGMSKHCRKVPTGITRKEYKLVCDDSAGN